VLHGLKPNGAPPLRLIAPASERPRQGVNDFNCESQIQAPEPDDQEHPQLADKDRPQTAPNGNSATHSCRPMTQDRYGA